MAYPVGGVQRDEQGRAYIQMSDGRRNYISPVATGDGQRPEDTTGIFRQAPQWNQNQGEWETPIDWGNILTMATAGGLGAAGLSAAGVFGGGAAGGTLPSTQVGTGMGALPGAGTAGAGAGAGAAASMPGWLETAIRLGAPPAVAALARRGGGDAGGTGSSALDGPMRDQIAQLIDLAIRRGERTDPLHEEAINFARSRVPGGSNARVQQAARTSEQPRQEQTTNPRVLAAIQRLMEGQ